MLHRVGSMLGRPVLNNLALWWTLEAARCASLQGGQWTEIDRGKQDAMLLRLASTFNSIEDFENPQFDLRAKDDDHDDACSLQDFLQDLRAVERYEEMITEVQFTDDVSEHEFVDAETYVNVGEQVPDAHELSVPNVKHLVMDSGSIGGNFKEGSPTCL